MQQKIQQVMQIKYALEQVLGKKITDESLENNWLEFSPADEKIGLDLIEHYVKNPELVNDNLIATLVQQQLKKYSYVFNMNTKNVIDSKLINNWSDYILKLEQTLSDVKYRRANNYEYNQLLPPHAQLQYLQNVCWHLTEQLYGKGRGNISAFYRYFIMMSQAAGITSFSYDDITKFVSEDRYITQVNFEQRHKYYQQHRELLYADYIAQGGYAICGRSIIDGVAPANTLYYKKAQQYLVLTQIKNIVVQIMQLENYGQLAYNKRVQIWDLVRQHVADIEGSDIQNVFYKFAQFLNFLPGANNFSINLPFTVNLDAQQVHNIIKIAGIQSNNLILLSKKNVVDWLPRRYIPIGWHRKFALQFVNDNKELVEVRSSGINEHTYLRCNELPYTMHHGLSLGGDGLNGYVIESEDFAYEWNAPVDPKASIDNVAHDIEKLFRELKILSPYAKNKPMLDAQMPINVFHNSLSYSTVKANHHTQIASGYHEDYPLYNLTTNAVYVFASLSIKCEIVQVGTLEDAIYLRISFPTLDDDKVIKFLLDLNLAIYTHFGGHQFFDSYLHLFPNRQGNFVFIYEPYARLEEIEGREFLNPENGAVTMRKPQFLHLQELPNIELFPDASPYREGLAYLQKFFDGVCKRGVCSFIQAYLTQQATVHQ